MQATHHFARVLTTGAPNAATVAVYLTGTLTLAAIYSDNQVVPTPMANPTTAPSTGLVQFYAANGRYDLTVTPTIGDPYTLAAVLVYASDGV